MYKNNRRTRSNKKTGKRTGKKSLKYGGASPLPKKSIETHSSSKSPKSTSMSSGKDIDQMNSRRFIDELEQSKQELIRAEKEYNDNFIRWILSLNGPTFISSYDNDPETNLLRFERDLAEKKVNDTFVKVYEHAYKHDMFISTSDDEWFNKPIWNHVHNVGEVAHAHIMFNNMIGNRYSKIKLINSPKSILLITDFEQSKFQLMLAIITYWQFQNQYTYHKRIHGPQQNIGYINGRCNVCGAMIGAVDNYEYNTLPILAKKLETIYQKVLDELEWKREDFSEHVHKRTHTDTINLFWFGIGRGLFRWKHIKTGETQWETPPGEMSFYGKYKLDGTLEIYTKKRSEIAEELREESFSVWELRNAGFTARQLRDAGFTIEEFGENDEWDQSLGAGFTPQQLLDAGFTYDELKNIGFTPHDLRPESNLKILMDSGFTTRQLTLMGYTPQELSEITIATTDNDPSYSTDINGLYEDYQIYPWISLKKSSKSLLLIEEFKKSKQQFIRARDNFYVPARMYIHNQNKQLYDECLRTHKEFLEAMGTLDSAYKNIEIEKRIEEKEERYKIGVQLYAAYEKVVNQAKKEQEQSHTKQDDDPFDVSDEKLAMFLSNATKSETNTLTTKNITRAGWKKLGIDFPPITLSNSQESKLLIDNFEKIKQKFVKVHIPFLESKRLDGSVFLKESAYPYIDDLRSHSTAGIEQGEKSSDINKLYAMFPSLDIQSIKDILEAQGGNTKHAIEVLHELEHDIGSSSPKKQGYISPIKKTVVSSKKTP